MYTLGIDIGSSSIKVSVLNTVTGQCCASSSLPKKEMEIKAIHDGWAEQNPKMWKDYLFECITNVRKEIALSEIKVIWTT